MSKIERIKVTGFWESLDFDAKIHSDVTFFIGANGTGKTTLINLIAAALVGDFFTLERTPFTSLEIGLTGPEQNKRPFIAVTKRTERGRPYQSIHYKIRALNGEEQSFLLDDMRQGYLFHDDVSPYMVYERQLKTRRQRPRALIEALQALVEVSWLSIHRITNLQRSSDEKSFESTVDRKLEQQSSDLVKYFSSVNGQKDEEMRKFQEFIFLSLIEESPGDYVLESDFSSLPLQRAALVEIFKELRVLESTFADRLESFFSGAEALAAKKPKQEHSYTLDEFEMLMALHRLDQIIEKWKTLQSQLAEIFQQQNRFLTTVNGLFRGKSLRVNKENEIYFENDAGRALTKRLLSSGEKQLLILLTEALLQRNRAMVFIADEPELSLHVTWQEKLVSSLRTVNPEAQIIMATHSPDIVGNLSEHVIDMESLTYDRTSAHS